MRSSSILLKAALSVNPILILDSNLSSKTSPRYHWHHQGVSTVCDNGDDKSLAYFGRFRLSKKENVKPIKIGSYISGYFSTKSQRDENLIV